MRFPEEVHVWGGEETVHELPESLVRQIKYDLRFLLTLSTLALNSELQYGPPSWSLQWFVMNMTMRRYLLPLQKNENSNNV